MHTTRTLAALSVSLLLGSMVTPLQAAPLPNGTVLTIDPGINDATSPRCYTGSCFSMAITLTTTRYHYNFVPGTDGGIVVGKNQAAGVSPAPGELAGYNRVDAVEAPGSMFTTSYQSISSDASSNIFDDQSCLSASACAGKTVLGTWNKAGSISSDVILGSDSNQCTSTLYCPGVTKWTITPAGAAGLDGDRYILEYQRLIPLYQDGYDRLYTFHLEGTIKLPKVNGVDVAASLSATPNPATQGAALTYTATLTNFGTETATGVSLSDELPIGVNFVSAIPSQGYCNGTAAVGCTLGDLASGASATVAITVTPTVTGTLANSITTTANGDVNAANDTASSSIVVNAPVVTADLGVSLSATPSPVKRLSNLTYTINVNNAGPGTAEGVTVKDTLPLGMSLVSATSSQGTCSGSTTVTCTLGALASGANGTVTLIVQPRFTGSYSNKATVSTTTKESSLTNNSATVKVRVN